MVNQLGKHYTFFDRLLTLRSELFHNKERIKLCIHFNVDVIINLRAQFLLNIILFREPSS